jgi:hypothetical protein
MILSERKQYSIEIFSKDVITSSVSIKSEQYFICGILITH